MKEFFKILWKTRFYLKLLFYSDCPKCKSKNSVRYIGDEFQDFVWLSISECEKCGEQFI